MEPANDAGSIPRSFRGISWRLSPAIGPLCENNDIRVYTRRTWRVTRQRFTTAAPWHLITTDNLHLLKNTNLFIDD